jgi:exosortase/archaeosortase
MEKRNKMMRLMLFGSIGSSLLGLPYVCRFLEVNTGVMQWGIFSVFIGLVLLCSTVSWDLTNKTTKYLLVVEFSLLSILQLVPIYYWFAAHSQTMAVSTFSRAISHFGYTIPHFLLLFTGVLVVYHLLNKNMIPNLNQG